MPDNRNKLKGKVVLELNWEPGYEGVRGVEVRLHLFLTSALDESDWQVSLNN
jgi:hypothetical protein